MERFNEKEMNKDDFRFLNLLILVQFFEIISNDPMVLEDNAKILYSEDYILEKSERYIGHPISLTTMLDKIYTKELGGYVINDTLKVIRHILEAYDLGWSDISDRNNLRHDGDEYDYSTGSKYEQYIVQGLHHQKNREIESEYLMYKNASDLKKYIRDLKIDEVL